MRLANSSIDSFQGAYLRRGEEKEKEETVTNEHDTASWQSECNVMDILNLEYRGSKENQQLTIYT